MFSSSLAQTYSLRLAEFLVVVFFFRLREGYIPTTSGVNVSVIQKQ